MTDSCPRCLTRGIHPADSRQRGRQIVDGYQCPGCGHTWATARQIDHYPAADIFGEDAA